jgi:TPR repeat protein
MYFRIVRRTPLPWSRHVNALRPHSDTGAAYELGLWCEREGDLEQAVRWFRRPAEAGHPAAALRLSDVLGRLADGRGARQGVKTKQSPDMLVAEATRWLSVVKTGPDAIELVTDMLNRQQRLAARRHPAALTP